MCCKYIYIHIYFHSQYPGNPIIYYYFITTTYLIKIIIAKKKINNK